MTPDNGILSVLPPEVRGRVGGYTKLAGIAPMDVLKDGVKVSEVSGMNGAIVVPCLLLTLRTLMHPESHKLLHSEYYLL